MKAVNVCGGILRLASDSQIEEIHRNALNILSQIGVKLSSRQLLEICREKGALITNGCVVRMSKEMVEWGISAAPSQVLLAGRNEEFDLNLEKNRVYLGTGGAVVKIYDADADITRPAKLSDLATVARLCDALDNIHFFIRPIEPPSMSKEELDIHKFYVSFANTRKHVMGAVYSKESAAKVIDMASSLAGGIKALRERPFVSFISASISPLVFDTEAVEIIFEIVKMGLPVALPASPVAGSTGPASLPSLISLAHAEALASVVLAQIIRPGAPVLYGPIPRPVNWRTMNGLKGGIESGMMNAIMAQLSHYIEIPQYADAGGTEAKKPDIQAGYEAMANIMLVALAGGNFIHHAAGLLDSDSVGCKEKYAIDDDICGLVIRTLRGITIDNNSLAIEILKSVCPGGNFLTEKSTLQNVRSGEIFAPLSACRNEPTTALQKANYRVKDILAKHHPDLIDTETNDKLIKKFALIFDKKGDPM